MSKFTLYCLVLIGLCGLNTIKSSGQLYYNQRPEYIKANSQWALSTGGLNFNNSPATVTSIGSGYEGIASAADPITGDLLFYSDGVTCYDANSAPMPNGSGLLGNGGAYGFPNTTQGVCIVPFIGQPGKYYLFSLTGYTAWSLGAPPDTFLYYSVVDMALNGGLGDIVPGEKNIPLGDNTPLSESMIAIPGDNCDIWLMVHDYINPVFRAFHITRQGVDTTPVISTAGTQIQGIAGMGAYSMGGMAISPDRKTLGITTGQMILGAIPGGTGALLCKFNAVTGAVSDAIQVNQTEMVSYTMAFSPDNTKIYFYEVLNSSVGTFTAPGPVIQYDISVPDSATIAASQVTVGYTNGLFNASGYLKSYDGKIYLIPFIGTDSLFVIDQPNLPGMACNFHSYTYANPAMLTFGGPSLPNDVVYAFPPDTLTYQEDTAVCTRDQLFEPVTLTASAGYYGYVWDNGATGPVRNITAPGTYWVLCKDSCHSLIDSFTVAVQDVTLSLGPDTTLCNQTALTLDATVQGATYLWQDGTTGSTMIASDSGRYWVQVSASGCTVADTIHVRAIDLRQELGDDIVLCLGEAMQPATLNAYVPGNAMATWSTGSHASSMVTADTGIYWVRVEEAPCTASDTIRIVSELCTCQLGIPNAFSPNGDGTNDEFLPVIENGCAVKSYELSIYNRYGARVYTGHNYGAGWKGNYPNGAAADAGTYMYVLTFKGGTKSIPYQRKGDIILIR